MVRAGVGLWLGVLLTPEIAAQTNRSSSGVVEPSRQLLLDLLQESMFQLFRHARWRHLISTQLASDEFKVRSAERDDATDRKRIQTILNAIETVLSAAEAEQKGLNQRVEDVLARAAITVGNASDEYLDREPLDSHHQDLFSEEISNGQSRLNSLADMISHFKFLRAAALSRFPGYKTPAGHKS